MSDGLKHSIARVRQRSALGHKHETLRMKRRESNDLPFSVRQAGYIYGS